MRTRPWRVGLGMTASWLVFVAAFAVVAYLLAEHEISGFAAGTTLGLLGALTGITWALLGGYAYYVACITREDG